MNPNSTMSEIVTTFKSIKFTLFQNQKISWERSGTQVKNTQFFSFYVKNERKKKPNFGVQQVTDSLFHALFIVLIKD